MRVSRRGGRIRLRLEAVEVQILSSLLDELDDLLTAPAGTEDAEDAVLARLFPAAHRDDADIAAEFRELTGPTLRSERDERIQACRADLALSPDVDLTDPDTGRRWLQVLNDLRLALGTRLGIGADDDHEVDPDAADAQPRAIYLWLTAMQDHVVNALMR